MKVPTNVTGLRRSILIWYAVIIIGCFGLCYVLAGPYYLVQRCEDGLHFFAPDSCRPGIEPLIVKMNAETLDTRVGSLLPPLSYTRGVGWHLLGTDVLGRDVFAGILYGGQRSLLIGFISGSVAMIFGWLLGIWSVYVRWFRWRFSFFWGVLFAIILMSWLTGMYFWLLLAAGLVIFKATSGKFLGNLFGKYSAPWMWGRWIEWYQALPDLLLILVLSSAIGILNLGGMILIIVAVVWPSMAMISRRMATEVSEKPYFSQALRNKVSGKNLVFHYLWKNTRSVFFALFPLVVARIILLESTISFLGMGLPPDMVTIGSMISAARYNLSAWWLIVFSCLFIFFLVYPLMYLSLGLKSATNHSSKRL